MNIGLRTAAGPRRAAAGRQGVLAALLAGTTLVGAACGPPVNDAPDTLWGTATAVEELAIGVEFGADEYMFGWIRSLAVAGDGTMYVSDSQANVVRMYDAAGTFVRTIGRQGQGPGEYSSAPYLRVRDDGTLLMRNPGSARISFFSPAGEYVDSLSARSGIGPIELDPQGNLYLLRGRGGSEMVKYSVEGEELGRIEMPPRETTSNTFLLGREDVWAFPLQTVSAWSPLGYPVTGRTDAYDIELRKPDGTVHVRRDLAPVPLASDERAEWEVFRRGILAQQRAMNDDQEADPIPSVKPFFRDLWVGDDGRIWVWRYVAAEKRDDIEPVPEQPDRPLLTWREPWTYDVFEPDGTLLGSVVVPERLRPFAFRGDRIWGAIIDEDGIEKVVRLRAIPEGS